MLTADPVRLEALSLAVELWADRPAPFGKDLGVEVIADARQFTAFLRTAASLTGTVTVASAGRTLFSTTGGNIMASMTVDQTATITVTPEDDHGDVTPDVLAWTTDDPSALIGTLVVAADTHSAVFTPNNPGGEGTVNVSASDPSSPALAPFVATLDVGAGATSQLAGSVVIA